MIFRLTATRSSASRNHINRRHTPVLAVCLCLVLATPGAHAAEVLIDDFSTPGGGNSIVDGPGILGGERDSTSLGGHLANVAAGAAVMSKPPEAAAGGFVIFQWAGNDDDAVVAYELGDVDLTDGGSNGFITLAVSSVTGTVDTTFTIRESSSAYGAAGFEIDHPGVYEFTFESLGIVGLPPDYTKVNFINLRFILDPGEAITITRFSATSGSLVFEDGFENPPNP